MSTPSLHALPEPFHFDGTRALSLGQNQNILSNVEAATLAAWIKLDSVDQNYQDIIVVSVGGSDALGTSRACLRVPKDGFLMGFGRNFEGREAAPEVVSLKPVVVPGQWQHIAVVIHYLTNTIDLYLSGKPVDTRPVLPALPSRKTPATLSNTVVVGAEDDMGSAWVKGYIAQVGIWGRALSAEDIRALATKRP